jgi:subtilisin family serine protease
MKKILISLSVASLLSASDFYYSNNIKQNLSKIGDNTFSIANSILTTTNHILVKGNNRLNINNIESKYNISFIKKIRGILVFDVNNQDPLKISNSIYENEDVKFSHPSFKRSFNKNESGWSISSDGTDNLSNLNNFSSATLDEDNSTDFLPNGLINYNKYVDFNFSKGAQEQAPLYSWQYSNLGNFTFKLTDSKGNEFLADAVKDMDVNIIEAWSTGLSGDGVKIGVIDDAFDFAHKDLSFHSGYSSSKNSKKISFKSLNNASWHGTQTSALIGAKANNDYGIAGISHNADLIGLSGMFDATTGSESIEFMLQSFSNAEKLGSDIINCSWGTVNGEITDAERDVINDLATNGRNGLGTIIVFASGNQGRDSSMAESKLDVVFNVGSISPDGKRANYSNYGPTLDFVAPGSVLSLDYSGDDGKQSGDLTMSTGTSFAAPIVSGVIGLVLEANPKLSRVEVFDILAKTSKKNPEYTFTPLSNNQSLSRNDEVGFGLVDAKAAVDLAISMKKDRINKENAEAKKINELEKEEYLNQHIEDAVNQKLSEIGLNDTIISELDLGWHLLGTSVDISDMSIFDSSTLVFARGTDQKWDAWSPLSNVEDNIKSSGKYDFIETIPKNNGIWVLIK